MGRPTYEPTLQDIATVEALVAAGWGEREIADVVGIARETLRRHFRHQLQHGRLKCRAEVLSSLRLTAMAPGNVAAKKLWLEVMEKAGNKAPEHSPANDVPEPLRAAGVRQRLGP